MDTNRSRANALMKTVHYLTINFDESSERADYNYINKEDIS